MKGKFIVIDGTDGSGKATQTKLLVERLKKEGYDVETIDFPQHGQKSAALVEEYLNGKFGTADEVSPYQASLFYAVDRYAAARKIRTWLVEGKIVIGDRYCSSNMGHQTGKIKGKEEQDKFLDWVEDLEFNVLNIPKPDMTVLLFVPPEKNQELVEKKGKKEYIEGESPYDIHTKDLNHLKKASEAYRYCAEKFGWPIIECTKDNKLMSVEAIHEMVWEKVKEIIK
ncbi:dTMP kinase [Candidatus Woesearchaeota archaeon]|nr:dTMP kinase [Candidatus Woesearchaeota archaeon]